MSQDSSRPTYGGKGLPPPNWIPPAYVDSSDSSTSNSDSSDTQAQKTEAKKRKPVTSQELPEGVQSPPPAKYQKQFKDEDVFVINHEPQVAPHAEGLMEVAALSRVRDNEKVENALLAYEQRQAVQQRLLGPNSALAATPDANLSILGPVSYVELPAHGFEAYKVLRELIDSPPNQAEAANLSIEMARAMLNDHGVPTWDHLQPYEQQKQRAFIGLERTYIKKQFSLITQMTLSIQDYCRFVHVLRTILGVYMMSSSELLPLATRRDGTWIQQRWDQLVEKHSRTLVHKDKSPVLDKKGSPVTDTPLRYPRRVCSIYAACRRIEELERQRRTEAAPKFVVGEEQEEDESPRNDV